MIQKIQALEIPNKGFATEVKVEVQDRFTTSEKAIIYYDFRDPSQTMEIPIFGSNEAIILPYKILSYYKINVTGEDKDFVAIDPKNAVTIFSRERPDVIIIKGIKLSLSSDDSYTACSMYSKDDYYDLYLDTDSLETASLLSETEDMNQIIEKAYYVSDGKIVRFWDGKGFDSKFLEMCK